MPRVTTTSFKLPSRPDGISKSKSNSKGNGGPPNPIKRSQRDRTRVTQACDRCKIKKLKCCGTKPCNNCIKGDPSGQKFECSYMANYSRGQRPLIPSNPDAPADSTPSANANQDDSSPPINDLFLRPSPRHLLPRPSSDNDSMGGGARGSGYQQEHSGSNGITNTGSPHGLTQEPPIEFPPRHVAQKMVATYFERAQLTMIILYRPWVESWVDSLLSPSNSMLKSDEFKSQRAIIFMIFAQVQEYMTGNDQPAPATGMRWFQLATNSLESEIGDVASIQARLLQCLFLLSRGQIDDCYTIFGTVITLIKTLKLHRNYTIQDPFNQGSLSYSYINAECQKRVFWAAFTLDKYLSHALGRPQYLQTFETDQDLPELVDDRQLSDKTMLKLGNETVTPMFASNLISELSRIISRGLNDFYGVVPIDVSTHDGVARHMAMLEAYWAELETWKQTAAILIDPAKYESLQPIYQRQSKVVNLAYNNTIILLTRALILAREPRRKEGDPKWPLEQISQIDLKLLRACFNISEIAEDMFKSDMQLFEASWFLNHCTYSSTVVVYLAVLKALKEPVCRDYYLKQGQNWHKMLAISAVEGTFAYRCVKVLDEFWETIQRKMKAAEGGQVVDMNGGGNHGGEEGKMSIMKRAKYLGFARLVSN